MANNIVDYDGYDSELEEPPPKKPLIDPSMNSKPAPQYKTNKEPLHGFTSYEDKEAWKIQTYHLRKMDAYTRHKELIRNYVKYYGGKLEDFNRDPSKDKNDYTVLAENHKFLWEKDASTWEERLAKRYHDKLYKEYCIGDLSRYEEKRIALRWRTEKEVKDGKGQFVCGNKKCAERDVLSSWEVNFAYKEDNEKKNALVKIRLCPECSIKLNLIKKVKQISKRSKRKERRKKRLRENEKFSEMEIAPEQSVDNTVSSDYNADESLPQDIWKGPAPQTLIKTAEEEIDEFLDDLFL